MDTCSRLSLYWMLICITLHTVLKAQSVIVQPIVIGYLGQDVTLPGEFDRRSPESIIIIQVEWTMEEVKKIIVFNPEFGIQIPDPALKDRVEFANKSTNDFSLIIRDVQSDDAGLYTCSITTYPTGTVRGTTNLTVQDQPPEYVPRFSAGIVAGIVVAVILLFVVTAATAYLIVIKKRQKALINHTVSIDTSTAGRDAGGAFTREKTQQEDLVYSDIQFKSTSRRDNAPSFKNKQTGVARADDVTYSEVTVGRHQHNGEDKTIYAVVTKK